VPGEGFTAADVDEIFKAQARAFVFDQLSIKLKATACRAHCPGAPWRFAGRRIETELRRCCFSLVVDMNLARYRNIAAARLVQSERPVLSETDAGVARMWFSNCERLLAMLAVTALALVIPLHFEPVLEQTHLEIRYRAVARQYTVSLSDTGLRMEFRGGSLQMNVPRARLEALDPLPGKSNYYFGSNAAAWRTQVPNYARVRYCAVFPGVDLIIYGKEHQVEYDWIVAPGADPSAIRFSFTGARGIHIDEKGDLVLSTPFGEVRHRKPYIYQTVNGARREVSGAFALADNGRVQFHIGDYHRRQALVIDPALVYSAGFGGSGINLNFPGLHGTDSDSGRSIAVDRNGNAYILGTTFSTDFPQVNGLSPGPSQTCTFDCNFESLFIAKLSADGSALLYSTYIAAPPVTQSFGSSPPLPGALTVDSTGNVFATGATSGVNFPVLGLGSAATAGGTDAFVLELDPNGLLKASQPYGGSGDDAGTSIFLGPDGRLYVAGITQSSNFPVSSGAYRTTISSSQDMFLLELNPATLPVAGLFSGAILSSTYLGPGYSPLVAADAAGNAYIAASTMPPAQSGPPCTGTGCQHILVMKLNPMASRLVLARTFGGSGTEMIGGLAVDASGGIYVSGTTTSTDFPTTQGAFLRTWVPNPAKFPPTYGQTGFVAKLSPDGSFAYATYLGGTSGDQANGITVDSSGNAYVTGGTNSSDFPVSSALQPALYTFVCYEYSPSGSIPTYGSYCGAAGFLSVLNPAGSGLLWSTYLGGGAGYATALDSSGNVYVTGSNINPAETALAGSPTGTIGVVKISPAGTPLAIAGIANAFSFNPGLPAPGGLASIFVSGLNISGTVTANGFPLPAELAGVSVLVDGQEAPLLGVANVPSENPLGAEQINFQVPFEAKSNLVEVRYNGVSTFALPQDVASGILTLSDGSPAIQHASDYSLVTLAHPAAKGETIIIYVTGLGPVNPSAPTGMPASMPGVIDSPAGVSVPGTVLYAGITPGFVGLYQINVQLASDVPSGSLDLYIEWFPPLGFPPPPNAYYSNTVKLPVE
jgi:uncharacterized protein (TIGR03437 family)